MNTKLKELRYRSKMTAKQMSEILGISKPFYCQLENNKRRLSYLMAIKISGIFGQKPDSIFYDDFKAREND